MFEEGGIGGLNNEVYVPINIKSTEETGITGDQIDSIDIHFPIERYPILKAFNSYPWKKDSYINYNDRSLFYSKMKIITFW